MSRTSPRLTRLTNWFCWCFLLFLMSSSFAACELLGLDTDDGSSNSCIGGDCDTDEDVLDEAPPECDPGTHWSSILEQCVPDNVTPADEETEEEANEIAGDEDEQEWEEEFPEVELEEEAFESEEAEPEEEIEVELDSDLDETPELELELEPEWEPELEPEEEIEPEYELELEPELEPEYELEPEFEPELELEPELEPEAEAEEEVPQAIIEGSIYLLPWHRQEMVEVYLDDEAREAVGPVLTLGPAGDNESLTYRFSISRGRYWIHARLQDSPEVTGRFLGNSITEGEDSVFVDPDNIMYSHFDGIDFLLGENGSCDVLRVAQSIGHSCVSGADCEQNSCLIDTLGDEEIRFCSQFCDVVTCPDGWSCLEEDPLGQVCRPDDASQSLVWGGDRGFGEGCNVDDDCAEPFVCDKSRDDQWICTYSCTENEVCGLCGYCDSGICRPQHSPGAFGDFCHDETDCTGGVQYCVADMCTTRCYDLPGTQGSCPDGTLCLVYIQNVAQLCLPEDWEAR